MDTVTSPHQNQGVSSHARMITSLCDNGDAKLFQLFIFFYIATCRKNTKSGMSEICASNFGLLFVVIVFGKVYMQQDFIVLQVSFYFILLTILLTLNVDMLLKEINLFIESFVSVLRINLNRYFVHL